MILEGKYLAFFLLRLRSSYFITANCDQSCHKKNPKIRAFHNVSVILWGETDGTWGEAPHPNHPSTMQREIFLICTILPWD
jgi:hypothetical protein